MESEGWIGGASRDRKARHSENRQVIDSSRILQCPESLKHLQGRFHCTFIVRQFSVKAKRLNCRPFLSPWVQKLVPTLALVGRLSFIESDFLPRSVLSRRCYPAYASQGNSDLCTVVRCNARSSQYYGAGRGDHLWPRSPACWDC